jgi:hypothetical protein
MDTADFRWTDLWMMSGSAMRLAVPTRLNESSSQFIHSWKKTS